MILHDTLEVFCELIRATANQKKIPELYIEKDYWITHGLKRFHKSKLGESVVFKGGTSLSKAHGILERFSEDIDLALIREPSMTDAQCKTVIKAVERTISQGLSYVPGHPLESKHGRFRKTAYAFPTQSGRVVGEQAANEILIEINSFADPEPAAKLPVGTLIADYLNASGHEELVKRFALESFEILVLGVERTLCEKLMSLVRANYERSGLDEFRRRIRHFYDIVMILRKPEYRRFVGTDYFGELMNEVRRCDRESFQEAPSWLDLSMSDAKIFSGDSDFWNYIERGLKAEIRGMLFSDEIPEIVEVKGAFALIRNSLHDTP